MATTAEPMTHAVDPMVPRPMRILHRRAETDDTFTLELETGPDGYPFAPGQFNMLYAFGVGEVAISISGDPTTPSTLIHTVRAVGAVTSALGALEPGDWVGVRGPFGIGWPVDEAIGQDAVVIAGGIGLAPLRPAIYHLLANRARYNQISVGIGFRSPAEMLFEEELREWRSRFDLEIEVTVDSASESWYGPVGVVTKLIPRLPFDPSAAVAMVCGPEIMMRFTVETLAKRALPDSALYLSMERNMKCGLGYCGHCQFGPTFVCKEGPVFRYDTIDQLVRAKEI